MLGQKNTGRGDVDVKHLPAPDGPPYSWHFIPSGKICLTVGSCGCTIKTISQTSGKSTALGTFS